MQEKLFDILFKSDDISWQSMIFDAVRTQQMDPWDVDITELAAKFLEMIKQLKEMDFKISGKMILAAAILLRLKSHKLVTDDLSALDRLIAMSEESEEDFYDGLLAGDDQHVEVQVGDKKIALVPRTPQPRKRKVSVYDLVEALEKALEVKNRRRMLFGDEAAEVKAPENYDDINTIIERVYLQIKDYFLQRAEEKSVKFSALLKTGDRKERIFTFHPLLHLSNQRHVDLVQEVPFSDFDIYLLQSDKPLLAPEEAEQAAEREKKNVRKKKQMLNSVNEN